MCGKERKTICIPLILPFSFCSPGTEKIKQHHQITPTSNMLFLTLTQLSVNPENCFTFPGLYFLNLEMLIWDMKKICTLQYYQNKKAKTTRKIPKWQCLGCWVSPCKVTKTTRNSTLNKKRDHVTHEILPFRYPTSNFSFCKHGHIM